jgi:transposase
LRHPPGHAQFDFGEVVVEIASHRGKAALGVIRLPYFKPYFVSAYARECTETFQVGHVVGFEFFGGVLLRTSYDNTGIAVSKVIGRERERTRAFLALKSHYPFDHHFCYAGRGYVPASKAGSELLFDVISTAYEHTSLIVTTNLPF